MSEETGKKAGRKGGIIGVIVAVLVFQIAAPFVFEMPDEESLNYVRMAAAGVVGAVGFGLGYWLGLKLQGGS